MEDNNAAVLGISIICLALVIIIIGLATLDKRMEWRMAQRGLCYQLVQMPNEKPLAQYQQCK